LYPEDIAALYDRLPIGTPVRIVNQPTVLGWRDGTVWVQAFGRMGDERAAGLASRPTVASIQAELRRLFNDRGAAVDWPRVLRESTHASGVPIPVSGGRDPSLVTALAVAPRVANVLPAGASWDGRGGSPEDEAQYTELLQDRDPQQIELVRERH
jgi:L,D-transpeptidase ErfK/SrfK